MKSYLFLALLSLTTLKLSAEMPEPSFSNTVEVDGVELSKQGEYRYVYRFFFELYDAALYAPAEAQAQEILNANTVFRLQFRYLREIEKSIILKSADRMLAKNLSDLDRASIAERVQKLNEAYTTVREGDRSSLTYQQDVGTTLRINGEPMVTVEGADFARLYFQIWLGEKPISRSLREALLPK